MNVRKFVANDARIALKKVKETLGPDAVILSNRTVDGQVEIMAVAARDMAMVVNTPGNDTPRKSSSAGSRVASAYGEDDYRVTLGSTTAAQVPSAVAKTSAQCHFSENQAPSRAKGAQDDAWRAAGRAAPAAAEPPAAMTTAMMDELRALRRIVEQQMAGFAWAEYARQQPGMTELLRQMLDAGFSPKLSNEWLAGIDAAASPEAAMEQLKHAAEQQLQVLGGPRDLVDEGGVFALVGPTGVGKTTTAAKLAARCVLRHGRDKVAMITSDGYRIGAHEQLRAYGRIMGVPVYAVRDPEELQNTLRDLAQKHLVLIDTMGMSQRDRHVGDQIGMFERCAVERLLLLNASTRGDTMDDIVSSYGGNGLTGCILSKIDEAVSLAPAIDVLIRRQLPLAYVANGQRVPEDLHLPNPSYLVHRAFKNAEDSSVHGYNPQEPALMMAGAGYFPGSVRHA